jgi:hypothetical protein
MDNVNEVYAYFLEAIKQIPEVKKVKGKGLMLGVEFDFEINELRKIEATYIQPRDTNFTVTLRPDVVVLPGDALERPYEGGRHPVSLQPGPLGAFRLTGGGFRLRR